MGSIGIVGLPGDLEGAPDPAVLERLRSASHVVVPSSGEVGSALEAAGVELTSFADLGLEPAAPAASIAGILTDLATEGDVVLATTGYPLLREGLVSGLLAVAQGPVDVFPVASPLSVILLAFDIDVTADLAIVDVESLASGRSERGTHLVVTGVRNAILARKTSELLVRDYPEDHPVVIAGCLESGGFDLDMSTVRDFPDAEGACDDTAIYVPPTRIQPPGGFDDLVRIISVLRGPDGCPWDREQTHESLRTHIIEEAYEVVSAIESGDPAALADELGDLMLQILLQAQIASEEGSFDIGDVTAGLAAKLRRRHPHIFGSVEVSGADEVSRNWDAIKREEKSVDSVLDGVPPGLPSLARAQKISRRAAGIGFDWETVDDVWTKVHEEIDELKQAREGTAHAAEEVGDVLFTVVNVARKLGVDAEIALRDACDKFSARFKDMERAAAEDGGELADLATDDMERLWHDAKQAERAGGAQE